MKTKKSYLLKTYRFLMICFFAFFISSCDPVTQTTERGCGTMYEYEERLELDPQFAQNEKMLEEEINRYIQKMKNDYFTSFRSGAVIIPVVVHVVYANSVENISDAQIQSQIAVLNEDYRRTNTDVSNVPTDFNSLVADVRIEFKLAKRDPSCNPTNGITRTSTTTSSFSFSPSSAIATARNPVKFSSSGGANAWPSDQYLNMWVCDLSGTLLGYASFPSELASRPNEDGVVIDYQYFGNTGTATSPFDLGRTSTHEIGHWLNLRHIWGDDCGHGCAVLSTSCSGTDHVGDTPNQECCNTGCPTHPNSSCSSNDMFMNYMDYVDDDCMIMFSNGQSDRMDAVLYTTRSSIVSSQGDVPPPSITQDLFSRDMADDTGVEPNTTSSYAYKSDDIWIRNSNDGITNQEHQNPIGGATNYVYVRVRNRGCATANSGNVKLYWSKASSGLSWPAPWDGSVTSPTLMGGFIGQKASGNVAASDFKILEYSWTAPNPADYSSFGADRAHFCLLSRIETSSTSPFGMTTAETSNLGSNVKNNNNIVWKNISVAEPTSGGRFASVLVSNYTKNTAVYKITFHVPKGEESIFNYGRVTAVLSDQLQEIWYEGGMESKEIEPLNEKEIMIMNSNAALYNIKLQPEQFVVIDIMFEPDTKKLKYERNVLNLDLQQYDMNSNEFIGAQNCRFRLGQ